MEVKKYFDHLTNALKLRRNKDVISIVGAGGKTSALIRLGKELSDCGKKVILSTTTYFDKLNFKLIRYSGELTDTLIEEIEAAINDYPAIVAKRRVRGNRIKGLSVRQVDRLNREVRFDYIITEADSANKKSLNAPDKYNPPVPQCTTLFIAVIGYDIIGKRLNISNVHHPQSVARIIQKPLNSKILEADIIALLKHPGGLLKGCPPATRTVVILNKVKESETSKAKNLADEMLKYVHGINSVICGEVKKPHQLLLFHK